MVGEVEEPLTEDGKSKAVVELGRKGGKARASQLNKAKRVAIAKMAGKTRWKQTKKIP